MLIVLIYSTHHLGQFYVTRYKKKMTRAILAYKKPVQSLLCKGSKSDVRSMRVFSNKLLWRAYQKINQ